MGLFNLIDELYWLRTQMYWNKKSEHQNLNPLRMFYLLDELY